MTNVPRLQPADPDEARALAARQAYEVYYAKLKESGSVNYYPAWGLVGDIERQAWLAVVDKLDGN